MREQSVGITAQLTINNAAGGSSSFDHMRCDGTGCNGGVITFSGVYRVTFITDSTVYSNNNAGSNGGVFFIDNQISDAFSNTITSCTFTSNTATKSGGVVYLSNTATTSLI